MAGPKIRDIWEALAACFAANDTPLRKAQIVAWINTHFPEKAFNQNTLAAQIYRSCVNVPSAQLYGAPKILFFNKEAATYSRADGTNLTAAAAAAADSSLNDCPDSEIDDAPSDTFALEAHLRDYLSSNLQVIERGLRLWLDEPPSVEYEVGGRRIDILAKDVNENPVVVELKLNRAYDRVVGQGLLYQSLVSRALNRDKVRVVLVAGDISEDLRMACLRLKDFELFQYSIAVQLERVNAANGEE